MKNPAECVFGKLYRGSRPENKQDLFDLWNRGFRTIICLQEGWSWWFGKYDGEKDWEAMGGTYIKRPLSNFFFPVKDELDSLVNVIQESPGRVLVHCFSGKDRTGILSGYYLVKMVDWIPKTAWRYIGDKGMHPWYRLLWKKEFYEACR